MFNIGITWADVFKKWKTFLINDMFQCFSFYCKSHFSRNVLSFPNTYKIHKKEYKIQDIKNENKKSTLEKIKSLLDWDE